MNNSARPVVLPNALSYGAVLWCAVLVAYFAAALLAYNAWCRRDAAQAAYDAPVRTPVEAELFSLALPAEFARYSLVDNHLTAHLHADRPVPLVSLVAQRDPSFAYRALDQNPAFLSRRIQAVLRDEGLAEFASCPPVVLTVEIRQTHFGVPVAHAYFDGSTTDGEAYAFFVGDVSYLLISLWEDGKGPTAARLRDWAMQLSRDLRLPTSPERFVRPIVNSAALTAAEHARILGEAERERALWKLYAERVETEPEAALLPAIEHFRKQLELLSSVREERDLLASDDFRRYGTFLKRREEVVRNWFVLLDKHVAVGATEEASKQAEFIVRHATLVDESLTRRRAERVGAEMKAKLEAAKASEEG